MFPTTQRTPAASSALSNSLITAAVLKPSYGNRIAWTSTFTKRPSFPAPAGGELQSIEIVERSGQHSDNLWIPASLVSLLVKDLQSLIARERRTICPGAYQRLIAVGHTDDTNKLGDLIPLQTIRIPRTIHLFMMMPDDIGHLAESMDGFDDLLPVLAVSLHLGPL